MTTLLDIRYDFKWQQLTILSIGLMRLFFHFSFKFLLFLRVTEYPGTRVSNDVIIRIYSYSRSIENIKDLPASLNLKYRNFHNLFQKSTFTSTTLLSYY